jgi:hypothetical protein
MCDRSKIPINDPKHWRERAEEARTVADEMNDPDSKRKMLRIAEDYEELARRAEKRLQHILECSNDTGGLNALVLFAGAKPRPGLRVARRCGSPGPVA